MKIAIVSLADSKYFHLLDELVDSIHSHSQSQDIKICILDGGLKKEQVQNLEKKVFQIKIPNIDFQISRIGLEKKPYLMGICARLFLREIFPDFDKYIWLDSDAWVNSWNAIELLLKASNQGKLAISSMSDRHTGRVLRVNWFLRSLGFIKSQNFKHAISSGYSLSISQKVGLEPHLNAGVFCLEKNSQFWDIWLKEFKFAVKKGRIFGSDQIALNIAVHILNQPVDILPHYCNWIPYVTNDVCVNTKFSEKDNLFVEKFTPNHPIGIMHLAGGIKINNLDIRFNKEEKVKIYTLENNLVSKNLRFQNKI